VLPVQQQLMELACSSSPEDTRNGSKLTADPVRSHAQQRCANLAASSLVVYSCLVVEVQEAGQVKGYRLLVETVVVGTVTEVEEPEIPSELPKSRHQ